MKNTFRILRTFCPPHLLEEIEMDLIHSLKMAVKSRIMRTNTHARIHLVI